MSAANAWTARARALPDGGHELLAPGVGLWTQAPPRGAMLSPGAALGWLIALGHARPLIVPAGVSGVVCSDPPQRLRAPVGAGEVLCVLAPAADAAGGAVAPAEVAASGGAWLLRAPQAGRFWRGPEPGAPPYAAEGEVLEPGRTYGLLEVMKTFQPVKYRAEAGLPARARLQRWLVADGAELAEGDPLAELGAA